MRLDGKLVIIKGQEMRSRKGKGTARQIYLILLDGRSMHSSKLTKLSTTDIDMLQRENKIDNILSDLLK